MSCEASAWAADQELRPLPKLLLLVLADNTDADGIAEAGREYLLRRTGMTAVELDAAFIELERGGHISPARDMLGQNGWRMGFVCGDGEGKKHGA